jgi:flagellar L-ring protein precursor FlgH
MYQRTKGIHMNKFIMALSVGCSLLSLTGCNTLDRLATVGKEPPLTTIENPIKQAGYQPISLPMPEPQATVRGPNSLWLEGSRSFFKDQRASRIGDILTIAIDIKDEAALTNKTSRTRSNTEESALTNLLGYETSLAQVLPEEVDNTSLTDISSSLSNEGEGSIDREEEIKLNVAAVIIQVLPNGNLVIHGRQEMRVNYEVRELQVAGIIRPEDIDAQNKISFEKIAEARISYGGRGTISDVQQPRYGQQLIDILMPF